jgi:aspartokinase-like uncharacterized kinase
MTREGPADVVVKVGGSLFDLPDLKDQLHAWLAGLSGSAVLLVPGGGAAADVIRTLDRRHRLGEERAHWLALRALSLNAQFLAALLPKSEHVRLLDAHAFALADEGQPGALPHTWDVTSDAVAARVAVVVRARRLVLLKSVTIPEDMDWAEAGRRGWVDASFAGLLRQAPGSLVVQAVNLRTWRPPY